MTQCGGRIEAERFLLSVRSSENAIQVARAVVDTSSSPSACFQAACILKVRRVCSVAAAPPAV